MSRHTHDHDHRSTSHSALLIALVFTTSFAVVEAIAGWWSNSLALMGDAGHMITDSLALGLSALAARMSRRPPSLRHSYGLKRAEVVGAMCNVALMLVVLVYIAFEAFARLTAPKPVNGGAVFVVAGIGLLINAGAAWALGRGERDLNVRGAMLHVMSDLLGSVAALVSGVVIWITDWYPIDSLLSLFIALLILFSSVRLTRDVLHIVMEGVPKDIDLEQVGGAMARVPVVRHIHDLHVWALDSSTYAVSAHVVIRTMSDWERCRQTLESMLANRFGISHATLQPETAEAFESACADKSCGPIFSNPAFGEPPGAGP